MDVITREDAKEDEPKDHKTAASASRCGILELPLPLIFDILSRLPNRAKLSCKSICKTFREVFRDPYFSEDLTKPSSLPSRLVIRQGTENRSEWCSFYLVNLFDLEGSSDMPVRRAPSRPAYATPTNHYQFTSGDGVMLVGSCNGLVCLMPFVHNVPMKTYCICNPFLGEFIVTPPVTQEIPDYSYLNFSRFVFSPKTRQYKIVHFSGQKNSIDPPGPTVAEIYTMGSESWRSTGEVPSPDSPATLDTSLNGILHWVSRTDKASDLICSLDIDTDKFQYVSPPAHLDCDFLSQIDSINVGVLNECLCLCYYAKDDCSFEVWVMKNYGLVESWTMEFDIDLTSYDFITPGDFRNFSFLENGDMLFQRDYDILVAYNHRTETFKWYKQLRYGRVCAFAHAPSLISLKVIADGKCADSVKQIRKAGFGWIGYLDDL